MAKHLRVVAKVLISDLKKKSVPTVKIILDYIYVLPFFRRRFVVTSAAAVHFGVFLYPFVISGMSSFKGCTENWGTSALIGNTEKRDYR